MILFKNEMKDSKYKEMIIYIWKGKKHQRRRSNIAKKFGIRIRGFESVLATLTYKCLEYKCLIYQSDDNRIIGILDKNDM